ncbi:sensor histidine kinase [Haloplanus sp. GCM10025708]|uniref:sensor histidine kinase n=1 Tax=Haloferacaceae TaxID=1644056 RepID=UPI00362312ED
MTTVYLLVEHGPNRALLADRLGDAYDVVEGPNGNGEEPVEASFDVCLGDVEAFERHRAALERRKSEADPVVLPYVLLLHRDQTNAVPSRLESLVDDVVELPIRPALLEKRAETALRTRRQSLELQRRTEELEILNRVVRHDIRNDMNVVLGWLEQVAEHVDDDGRPALDRVTVACEHVVEITTIAREYVDGLLGEDRDRRETINLEDVVRHEVSVHHESFPAATFDLHEESLDLDVVGNEMLTSVFRNLLTNAVVHNDRDDPRVEVGVEIGAETVVVRVADNGPGVLDEQKELIFGRGGKGLDSPGTDMGLFLVDRIVDSYGGDVWIEDNEPRGSVFAVELRRPDAATRDVGGET